MLELDMSGQADLFAEDGIIRLPFAPVGAPREIRGREEIRAFLVQAGERVRRTGHRPVEYRNDLRHQSIDPGVVISQFEVHIDDGSETGVDIPYLQVLTVRDGEITCLADYFTPFTASMKLDTA